MLRQAVNEVIVKFGVRMTAPFLLKDGRVTDQLRQEIRNQHNLAPGQGVPVAPLCRDETGTLKAALAAAARGDLSAMQSLKYYVPGSSLRGTWRSYLEMLLRSEHQCDDARVCDPLVDDGPWKSCSKELDDARKGVEGRLEPERPYERSCPICRLFGNTQQSGRIWIGDASVQFTKLTLRDHVAIDRKTGGPVPRKLFSEIALVGARFAVEIRIRNFELFHIYLLAVLVDEIKGGRIPLGSAKSRGYGLNTLDTNSPGAVILVHYGLDQPDNIWRGLAEDPVHGQRLANLYGVRPWPNPPGLNEGNWQQAGAAGWRWCRAMSLNSLCAFLTANASTLARETLNSYRTLSTRIDIAPPPAASGESGPEIHS